MYPSIYLSISPSLYLSIYLRIQSLLVQARHQAQDGPVAVILRLLEERLDHGEEALRVLGATGPTFDQLRHHRGHHELLGRQVLPHLLAGAEQPRLELDHVPATVFGAKGNAKQHANTELEQTGNGQLRRPSFKPTVFKVCRFRRV